MSNYFYDQEQKCKDLSFETFNNLDIKEVIAKSNCQIEYTIDNEKKTGKGFLLKLPVPDSKNPIRGLITTYDILNNNILYNSQINLHFTTNETTINLIPKEHFCFSDHFIDITFIELKNPEFDGFVFLEVDDKETNLGYAYILQDLKGGNISKGKIMTRYGFKLFHTVQIDEEFSGSALISLENNKVIGIHTNKQNEDNNHNIHKIAISMQAIIQAIRILFNSYMYNKSAFEEKEKGIVQKKVKSLSISEINELRNHGLEETSRKDIFISPASFFITPLWFYRTNYAWYWTPVEPKNNCADVSNWIIIYPGCSLKVIGGYWDGMEPAQKNINLIHWLESTGLDYLV